MAVTKRIRFEVLKRDGHACRYCGAKAGAVELEIDHVTPKSLGGTDTLDNLVASCSDCNSGKASTVPDEELAKQVAEDSEIFARAKALAMEGKKAPNMVRGFEWELSEFDAAWNEWWITCDDGTREPIERPFDWKESVRVWLLRGLPIERICDCVGTAMRKKDVHLDKRWAYFCGVVWNTLREAEEQAAELYEYLKREDYLNDLAEDLRDETGERPPGHEEGRGLLGPGEDPVDGVIRYLGDEIDVMTVLKRVS